MNESLPLRVMVHESWDEIDLELPADATIERLKIEALEAAHTGHEPDRFEVKFRGALIRDESLDLKAAGLVPNAQLIVLAKRRQPVR